ncbi:MAG TPA: precorrin-6y C5,15-methyltransferase (decarboxylating) subunit CbiE [Candidatus Butyricicoccus avistercoris]|uniref:Precorrin-6y C5,15-methyltransferase (Decarboxylating) subunit CbiE n=1 Tax=Candidatus Butyricicoccus avistercoris TaxID=2838518 RepID=A0A9D1PIC5_9FIRM|nr:precorrin-6y C5,15-methyltransferase (decarboxylating) subunit CbiE [Candidatus Butyricicoccus avistercoris]
MKKRLFSIIGAGSGQPDGLTREALDTIKLCDALISTERLAKDLTSIAKITAYETSKLAQTAISIKEEHIGILVSGDTGFFSVASSLNEKLKEHGKVEMICGLNSMQMLCAKFGVSYQDACFLSLHGRKGSLLGAVSYNKKVIALTGGEQNAQRLCQTLAAAGLGDITVSVGENIGSEHERILTDTAKNLSEQKFDDLAVMLVLNPNAAERHLAVLDAEMERGKVPMTKQEARWTAVKMLDLKPSDTVYDIGAGTGSISMEMARKVYNGMVYAIERKKEAIELIEKNRKNLGSFNVLPFEGQAANIIDKLPVPDAAFIGGSDGEMSEIITKLLNKNPKVKVIISAVSLETLLDAKEAIKNFDEQNIVQIHSIRGHRINDTTEFTSNNPIYLLYGKAKA